VALQTTSKELLRPILAQRVDWGLIRRIWPRVEPLVRGSAAIVMTLRPGRIKRVIDIPLESRSREEDLRGTPEFSRLRHEVWSLLRDEFRQAQILERERVSGAGAAA
jgi:NitT/TauT family transport system ATP-binding protein